MAQPSYSVRPPVVAGRFYPADAAACAAEAQSYLQPAGAAMAGACGAVVPHAGWICSGAVAGQAIATLARGAEVDLIVVFGAVHTPLPAQAALLDSYESWMVPGQQVAVHQQARQALATHSDYFVADDRFHRAEHAIEVELPMLMAAFGDKPVLPVGVPLIGRASDIGRCAAEVLQKQGLKAVYIASSDLTHYGANYDFAPAGLGPQGIAWAMDNDRRLLSLVTDMTPERIVPEVRAHQNACGGGAIAAAVAAALACGASRAKILWHTNSYETLRHVYPQEPDNAVGYAGVILGN